MGKGPPPSSKGFAASGRKVVGIKGVVSSLLQGLGFGLLADQHRVFKSGVEGWGGSGTCTRYIYIYIYIYIYTLYLYLMHIYIYR